MKFTVIAGLILAFFASCQSRPIEDNYFTRQKIRADEYHARIRAEKKRQAELDLPYRIISLENRVESLAFIAGTDNGPTQAIWGHIEKNRPTLAVMLSDGGVSALDPAYRSVREKVPFLAISSDPQTTSTEFLRNWPYMRNLTVTSDSTYHAVTLGPQKDTLQVIMLDSHRMNESQWAWLDSMLKKPVAVSVLVSAKSLGGSEKQKFLSLVKKANQRVIILLTTGGERTTITKTDVEGTKIFELSPQSGMTDTVAVSLSSDAPVQVAKPANFGMLKFDWATRLAVLEIRNSADERVEFIKTSF